MRLITLTFKSKIHTCTRVTVTCQWLRLGEWPVKAFVSVVRAVFLALTCDLSLSCLSCSLFLHSKWWRDWRHDTRWLNTNFVSSIQQLKDCPTLLCFRRKSWNECCDWRAVNVHRTEQICRLAVELRLACNQGYIEAHFDLSYELVSVRSWENKMWFIRNWKLNPKKTIVTDERLALYFKLLFMLFSPLIAGL